MNEVDAFSARIIGRHRLAWRDGGHGLGTPHPRAGSGLVSLSGHWSGGGLVLVQDDVSGLARFDPQTGQAESIVLPPIAGTHRFDPGFGAKRDKPDLESLVEFIDGHDAALWCFGSGSTPRRERIAIVTPDAPTTGHFIDLAPFYARLRELIGDPGGDVSGLNLEGACIARGELVLFQRGNGGGDAGLVGPATFHLSARAFRDHLGGGPVPEVTVRGHDLGLIEGVAWGFTDADALPDGRIAWIGAAEASPDTFDDGEVLGSVFGILDGPSVRIVEADGRPFLGKAEGLAMKPGGAWIAVDPDDPGAPTEVLELELTGAW